MPASFPDPLDHDFPEWIGHGDFLYYARDVISFGDELTLQNLLEAYTKGIFPWDMKGVPLPWFCPENRAILEFSELHIPRSLEKERRKSLFEFTIDKAFPEVINECSLAKRTGQKGTWITDEFTERYTELFELGQVHSVEAWDANGELAGGLYGVDAAGVFCGESMFFKKPNASKLALLFLIDHLKTRGSTWLDNQVMTPHFKAFGAKEIDRKDFLRKLQQTQGLELELFGRSEFQL